MLLQGAACAELWFDVEKKTITTHACLYALTVGCGLM